MALIPCPDCSHETSTSANACPRCGYPFRQPAPQVIAQPAPQMIPRSRTREVPAASRPSSLPFFLVVMVACVVAFFMGISRQDSLLEVPDSGESVTADGSTTANSSNKVRELSQAEYEATQTKHRRHLYPRANYRVTANEWLVLPVVLDRDAKLEVEFQVTTMGIFRVCAVFLVDSEDAWKVKDGRLAWRHGRRGPFTKRLAGENIRQHSASGFFPKGTYYLVVDNPRTESLEIALRVTMSW